MQTLSNELKGVIARRIELAKPDEIMIITGALAALEVTAAVATARPASDIKARFELVGDDIVRDHSTGLEWERSGTSGRMEWKDAKTACEQLKLGGHGDWRLPTIKELLSIVDYERSEPAIDTSVFNCESSWYWTSTPLKSSPGVCAWFVYFGYGDAFWNFRGYAGFVRAVRVGQF